MAKVKVNGDYRRRFPSLNAIAVELDQNGIHVVKETVRRDLKELKIKARRRPKTPLLAKGDAPKRVTFARRMLRLPKDLRDDIMFSDEKYFDCCEHGQVCAWCPHNYDPEPLGRTRWSPKVHVWGIISQHFQKLVFHVKGSSVTSEVYINKCLKPIIRTLRRHPFQQDGARCHTSKETMAFLNANGVDFINDWPARSPDLNMIEMLWEHLAAKASEFAPKTEAELVEAIKRAWLEMPGNVLPRFLGNFEPRLKTCIKHLGATVTKAMLPKKKSLKQKRKQPLKPRVPR